MRIALAAMVFSALSILIMRVLSALKVDQFTVGYIGAAFYLLGIWIYYAKKEETR